MQDISSKRHRSPAVQRLILELTAQIRAGHLRPGDYLPSAHTLAARYGVGYVSVIRAYKTLSEAGLVETVQGRGAFVRALPPALLSEVVVVLGSHDPLSAEGNPHSDWVFKQLLSGMNTATLARGVRLQLLFADAVGEQWRTVLDGLPAGSGVVFIMEAPPAWVLRLHRRGLPYALVLPMRHGAWEGELPCAYADYRGGVYAATAAQVAAGRRRAAYLGLTQPGEHEYPRYQGFQEALAAAGGTEVAVLECPAISREAAREVMTAALSAQPRPPFDLLVAGNDLRALGAIEVLIAHGLRVPEDVAVLGFDDIAAAEVAGLSTVRLPMGDFSERAIHWFLDAVAPLPAQPPVLEYPCPVVWRGSTQ